MLKPSDLKLDYESFLNLVRIHEIAWLDRYRSSGGLLGKKDEVVFTITVRPNLIPDSYLKNLKDMYKLDWRRVEIIKDYSSNPNKITIHLIN